MSFVDIRALQHSLDACEDMRRLFITSLTSTFFTGFRSYAILISALCSGGTPGNVLASIGSPSGMSGHDAPQGAGAGNRSHQIIFEGQVETDRPDRPFGRSELPQVVGCRYADFVALGVITNRPPSLTTSMLVLTCPRFRPKRPSTLRTVLRSSGRIA